MASTKKSTSKTTKKSTPKKSTTTKKEPAIIEENAEMTLEENNMSTEQKTTMENAAIAEKDKEINDLKSQIQQLQTMMMQFMANNAGSNQPAYASEPTVTLVHLLESPEGCSTHIELTSTTIDMKKFGEQRTLTRGQAEELAGKYRSWLDRGIIAFGEGSDELCSKLKIKNISDYRSLQGDFLGKLATIDYRELEELFNNVGNSHKAFIIEYFKRKIIEGDARFMDVQKVELLNRLSDGAMVNTIAELRR